MDEKTTSKYASWFRDSTPYISAHRGRTFVVLVGGDALAHDNLDHIVHDLALLHVLGVRVVLVHGARPQIDAALPNSTFHGPRRVTDPADMEQILGIFGQLRSRLEALFSTGLPTSPLHRADIAIVSGNFIVARPIGVMTGVDHLLTGKTRRVHAPRINAALDAGGLVMLSPLGYSPSGQAFNLAADELAADVAIALAADKLIAFDSDGYARDPDGAPITELSPTAAASILDGTQYSPATRGHLQAMVRATRGGVPRSHLVSFVQDGALLGELFTARGQGTQVSEKSSDLIRRLESTDPERVQPESEVLWTKGDGIGDFPSRAQSRENRNPTDQTLPLAQRPVEPAAQPQEQPSPNPSLDSSLHTAHTVIAGNDHQCTP